MLLLVLKQLQDANIKFYRDKISIKEAKMKLYCILLKCFLIFLIIVLKMNDEISI